MLAEHNCPSVVDLQNKDRQKKVVSLRVDPCPRKRERALNQERESECESKSKSEGRVKHFGCIVLVAVVSELFALVKFRAAL